MEGTISGITRKAGAASGATLQGQKSTAPVAVSLHLMRPQVGFNPALRFSPAAFLLVCNNFRDPRIRPLRVGADVGSQKIIPMTVEWLRHGIVVFEARNEGLKRSFVAATAEEFDGVLGSIATLGKAKHENIFAFESSGANWKLLEEDTRIDAEWRRKYEFWRMSDFSQMADPFVLERWPIFVFGERTRIGRFYLPGEGAFGCEVLGSQSWADSKAVRLEFGASREQRRAYLKAVVEKEEYLFVQGYARARAQFEFAKGLYLVKGQIIGDLLPMSSDAVTAYLNRRGGAPLPYSGYAEANDSGIYIGEAVPATSCYLTSDRIEKGQVYWVRFLEEQRHLLVEVYDGNRGAAVGAARIARDEGKRRQRYVLEAAV